MQIRMPKAQRRSLPDPQEVEEWLNHPCTEYLVGRLHDLAYALYTGGSTDTRADETLIKEAHKAQGVKLALEEMRRIADSVRKEGE